jgi:hypothetical protein
MQAQKKESRGAPTFQLMPPSNGKIGWAPPVVAVSSFAFLVFGQLADQPGLALAGYAEPIAVEAPVGQAAPRGEASLSRIVFRELKDPCSGRAGRMPRARRLPVSSANCV